MVVTHYWDDPAMVMPLTSPWRRWRTSSPAVYLVLSTVAFWIVRLVVRPKV